MVDRRTPEPVFNNPKVTELFSRWRRLWLLSMDRQKQLQDMVDLLDEVRDNKLAKLF